MSRSAKPMEPHFSRKIIFSSSINSSSTFARETSNSVCCTDFGFLDFPMLKTRTKRRKQPAQTCPNNVRTGSDQKHRGGPTEKCKEKLVKRTTYSEKRKVPHLRRCGSEGHKDFGGNPLRSAELPNEVGDSGRTLAPYRFARNGPE